MWLVEISNSNPITLNLLGADKTALFHWALKHAHDEIFK
jgi:hypothetical protein